MQGGGTGYQEPHARTEEGCPNDPGHESSPAFLAWRDGDDDHGRQYTDREYSEGVESVQGICESCSRSGIIGRHQVIIFRVETALRPEVVT